MSQSIAGSVGRGGRNQSSDVQTIQRMLNKVPHANGGPSPALLTDGHTRGANWIRTF